MSGIVGNADTWTATFTDASGNPTAPDGIVTWTVTVGKASSTTTQALGDAVSTGVYEFEYTPTIAQAYTVKASCVIGGDPQATPATLRGVEA